MCDYSLHHVKSRPAKVGEALISKQFENSITRGFVSPAEPDVAVCLLPGTELRFEKNVECVPSLWMMPKKKIRAQEARFRQIETQDLYAHRDALEFPDGKIVLLTSLVPGQRARVLQLPAGAKADAHHHHHRDIQAEDTGSTTEVSDKPRQTTTL